MILFRIRLIVSKNSRVGENSAVYKNKHIHLILSAAQLIGESFQKLSQKFQIMVNEKFTLNFIYVFPYILNIFETDRKIHIFLTQRRDYTTKG